MGDHRGRERLRGGSGTACLAGLAQLGSGCGRSAGNQCPVDDEGKEHPHLVPGGTAVLAVLQPALRRLGRGLIISMQI